MPQQWFSAMSCSDEGAFVKDGLLDSVQPLVRGTPPQQAQRRESGRNARAQDPIPLYDIIPLFESHSPIPLSLADQFSPRGAAPSWLDIFWVNSTSFIICSSYALEKFTAAVRAHRYATARGKVQSEHVIINLFIRYGTGTRSMYLGAFGCDVQLERWRLSNEDNSASPEALRAACQV